MNAFETRTKPLSFNIKCIHLEKTFTLSEVTLTVFLTDMTDNMFVNEIT